MAGLGCGRTVERARPPRNVIILIGDGMGFEHVKAGGLYANGQAGSLYMETLPYRGDVVTTPVSAENLTAGQEAVTDSAAAATALATGKKVYNGVLSVALPGDGKPYKTVLESFAAAGKRTGVVSTSYITDATPAAFGAHASGRGGRAEIVDCYLKTVRPNVTMGGGETNLLINLYPASIQAAGYTVVENRNQLAAVQPGQVDRLFGLFGAGALPYEAQKVGAATQPGKTRLLDMPSLSEMASVALKNVSTERKGFFLMIEGGLIDKAAHKNNLANCVPEVVEFDKTVRLAMDWARKHKDTLVIVTADHETGGLKVVQGCGKGSLPEVTWSTTGHTGSHVPLFAWGKGAKKVKGTVDNTDIYRLMMGTFRGSSVKLAAPANGPATAPAQVQKGVPVAAK